MNAFDTISQLLNGKKRSESEELIDSRNALWDSLTNDQEDQLEKAGGFWVRAVGGKRYLIRFKDGMIREERSANLWYLRIHGVNAYDEMAIKKSWLENAPEEILAAAKKIRLDKDHPSDPLGLAPDEKVVDWRLVKMTQSVTIASDWNAEEAANYIRRHLELKLKEPVHVWLQKNQFVAAGDLEVHAETAEHKAAYMVDMVQLAQTQYPEGIWYGAVEYLYRLLEIERGKARGPVLTAETSDWDLKLGEDLEIPKIRQKLDTGRRPQGISNKASPFHRTNLRAKSERLKKAVDRKKNK